MGCICPWARILLSPETNDFRFGDEMEDLADIYIFRLPTHLRALREKSVYLPIAEEHASTVLLTSISIQAQCTLFATANQHAC